MRSVAVRGRGAVTILIAWWALASTGRAQVFTPVSASIPGLRYGSVAWGDFDNDGDRDLLFAGFTGDTTCEQSSRLYRNSNGAFTNISSISLTAMSECSVAWADYDNDGSLDLLMAGSSIAGVQSYPTLRLYHNTGNGAGLTSVRVFLGGPREAIESA
jgi:hypothetical protein